MGNILENFKESVKDFSDDLKSTVAEKELDEETLNPLLEDLRLKLLKNNVSLSAAEAIEEELRESLTGEQVKRGKARDYVNEALREVLYELLDDSFELAHALDGADQPPTIFLMGFNGSGKTTTAGKLGNMLEEMGEEVVLGAGDTFRAASIEQLEEHGQNIGSRVISHEYESDPAAVAYDAIEHAENEGKIAIIDTAGRSHSDDNLMGELRKMVRVNEPDISFLVVDALAGNDVLEQADAYEGMFDAVIVTKMDVDESGGAIISISESSGKPVAYLGIGQEYEDIEEFDKEKFVDNILEE